jgi:catalase
MANPSPTDVLNQALSGFADAVGNYSAGKTALAFNRLNRSDKLSDIASQRDYEEKSADRASTRRQKEFTEAERQRLIQHYAELGVPVASDDTIEQANKKFRTFQEDRASRLLDHFGSNIKDVTDRKVQTVQELQGLVRRKLTR